ncbi:MAG: metallophosphoesterase [Candidatus Cloacimonadaceae bacterium]|nr:metallophosphoesterase [Candidatus Cloacimonadaceae bacterium]MDP3114795.1 metallophosphoesterase [Candidatus Cloacimonadaceae bacterium]
MARKCSSNIHLGRLFGGGNISSLRFVLIFLLLLTGLLNAKIAIYGDTRTNDDVHRQIVNAITAHEPHIAFHTGDLGTNGLSQEEYDNFFRISEPLIEYCAIHPAKGNHERDAALFLRNFPSIGARTYYSVSYDKMLFILLDSTIDINPGSIQYSWLQKELAENQHLPAIIILHHPIFSSGAHGDALGLGLFLPTLFAKHNVRAVFNGHDHNYERSKHNGITYVSTGGGGAPLRDARHDNPHSIVFRKEYHYCIGKRDEDILSVDVYAPTGEVLDSFLIHLRG